MECHVRRLAWNVTHNSGKSMPIIKPSNSTRKPLTAARRSKNKTMTDSNNKAAIHAITTAPQRWETSRDGENASIIKTKAKYTTKLPTTVHLNNCFNTFMRIAEPPRRREAPCVHPQKRRRSDRFGIESIQPQPAAERAKTGTIPLAHGEPPGAKRCNRR